MMQSKNILSLNSLKIGYVSGQKSNVLIPPFDATANKGELIAVIGRNGIGKSTLLRTMTGLQKSLGGDISIDGRSLKDYSRTGLAQKVGFISTEIIKVTNMSVYDLVALGRYPYTDWFGKITSSDDQLIRKALEETSMSAFSHRYISELSDGERQKAMIARLLAQDTDIMVMDEPTAFLDIGSRYEIFHLLQQLSKKVKKTIIFSTHDLQMAISQSDKIWLILNDKLKEGAPEDLIIGGAFDHLFESESVQFDPESGSFSSKEESKGLLYIEGDGIKKHWTQEAVKRAGFSVSTEQTATYIIIISGIHNIWQLRSANSIKEYSSIYDLIAGLNELTDISI
jgi:iron complex transport system ATP-binding protein